MKKLTSTAAKMGRFFQPLAFLVIRLAWGLELLQSGWAHLTHVSRTAAFFESLHIPLPVANVYLSGTTELVGGGLLMLGLFSRVASVPLFINFCVAYATASPEKVSALLHFHPTDFIDDSAFPFLVTSLLVFAFGPGKISFDAWLGNDSASK